MCTLPLFTLPLRLLEPTPFLPQFCPLRKISSIRGTSTAIIPSGTPEVLTTPHAEEVFDWVICSDLFPLSDPDTPTLLHRSSPDIFFAPSYLALFIGGASRPGF